MARSAAESPQLIMSFKMADHTGKPPAKVRRHEEHCPGNSMGLVDLGTPGFRV